MKSQDDTPCRTPRKILHIDMDAFYAAIEQRDNPELRGKPIVVGGSPNGRGVVATASYEARTFGLRSAMPASWAKQLCPQVIFVRPRMQAYREVSREVFAILRSHSELCEPLSLDEAYLDVSESLGAFSGSATLLAQHILREIFEKTNLTASAGVAPNKFLAKIASDMNKPNGLTVIPPAEVDELLRCLPIGKVPGVGKKTEEKMNALGIHTLGELRELGEEGAREKFGKNGAWFYQLSTGVDKRAVEAKRTSKSLSTEDTFAEDLLDPERISAELETLSNSLVKRAEKKNIQGRTLTLKVTYSDFTKISRSLTRETVFKDASDVFSSAAELASDTEAGTRPIRLLGLGISNFLDPSEAVEETSRFPLQLEFALNLVQIAPRG